MTRTHLPHTATRSALHSAAIALAIISTTFVGSAAASRTWEQGTVASDLLDLDPPLNADPSASVGRAAPFYFGFLEFDWDPNAPGGVPGFGPLPSKERLQP